MTSVVKRVGRDRGDREGLLQPCDEHELQCDGKTATLSLEAIDRDCLRARFSLLTTARGWAIQVGKTSHSCGSQFPVAHGDILCVWLNGSLVARHLVEIETTKEGVQTKPVGLRFKTPPELSIATSVAAVA